MWPGITQDTFGQTASITLDRSLYSDTTIFKSSYWFTDRFYVFLDVPQPGRVMVEFRPKETIADDGLQAAVAEFCNMLLDFRVREVVLLETAQIREALVTRAFMEGIPHSGFPGVESNEDPLNTP